MILLVYSIIGVIFAIVLISTIIGIPCLPTHRKQARKMIELAEIKPGDKVIDLGAGHGRLLFLAAQKGAHAVGYELNPVLVAWIWIKSQIIKTPGMVEIKMRSLFTADVRSADTVFCFLFPGYMDKLEEKLFSQMKPGTKIVAYVFPFPNKKYTHKEEGCFVYKIYK